MAKLRGRLPCTSTISKTVAQRNGQNRRHPQQKESRPRTKVKGSRFFCPTPTNLRMINKTLQRYPDLPSKMSFKNKKNLPFLRTWSQDSGREISKPLLTILPVSQCLKNLIARNPLFRESQLRIVLRIEVSIWHTLTIYVVILSLELLLWICWKRFIIRKIFENFTINSLHILVSRLDQHHRNAEFKTMMWSQVKPPLSNLLLPPSQKRTTVRTKRSRRRSKR